MPDECEHYFQYQGTVYSFGSQLPDSGARTMLYEDRYFCTKCLAVRDINRRAQGNSYEPTIEGTMPK